MKQKATRDGWPFLLSRTFPLPVNIGRALLLVPFKARNI